MALGLYVMQVNGAAGDGVLRNFRLVGQFLIKDVAEVTPPTSTILKGTPISR
jgi:hypothetical protein